MKQKLLLSLIALHVSIGAWAELPSFTQEFTKSNSTIEGSYQTRSDSYRLYNGNNVSYGDNYEIQITDIGNGEYYVDDLLGGWYCQRAGYGSDYAMTGYIKIGADGTVSLLDSYVTGWGDRLESLTGTYDAATSTFTIEAEYVSGMKFFQTWVKSIFFTIDEINYKICENNTVSVVKGDYSGNIIIPNEVSYNGVPYSVKSIGTAFSECSSLTSITIPNSVKRIGASAFKECSGLTSITIPNSVTSIGAYAFAYCI